MKKIIYCITKANWGGAQRYVFDLATSIPRNEFDVLVAAGEAGRLKDQLLARGIEVRVLESMQRNVSLDKDIRSFFELYTLFKQERPAVVHLNSSKMGGLGSLAARLSGVKKIIFTAHGWPFWEKRSGIARSMIWIASWLTALLCDRVIVISDYDARVARQMPFIKHKVIRIYNGINTHMQFGSGELIRTTFPPGVKITGTVGELNKNKNQQALIEEAKNKHDMYVAIVGEGEERKNLEAKIHTYQLETRVKLFGFIPAKEVMKGFDVFALPSTKEGLPYVLLEARIAKLPIVANRVGGVGEILDAQDMRDFSVERMLEKTLALYR